MGKQEPMPGLDIPIQQQHSYTVCKKCNKRGVYMYTPRNVYGTRTGTPVEYCKYCNPRTGAPKYIRKQGIIARLRKLFAG